MNWPRPRARPGQALPLGAVLITAVMMTASVAVAGGYVGLARHRLRVVADSAAHAGAQQIDVATVRGGGPLHLLPEQAAGAAWAVLAAEDLAKAASVAASPAGIEVTARRLVRLPPLARAMGLAPDGVALSATGRAAPRASR
jgi:hypothetical protein